MRLIDRIKSLEVADWIGIVFGFGMMLVWAIAIGVVIWKAVRP